MCIGWPCLITQDGLLTSKSYPKPMRPSSSVQARNWSCASISHGAKRINLSFSSRNFLHLGNWSNPTQRLSKGLFPSLKDHERSIEKFLAILLPRLAKTAIFEGVDLMATGTCQHKHLEILHPKGNQRELPQYQQVDLRILSNLTLHLDNKFHDINVCSHKYKYYLMWVTKHTSPGTSTRCLSLSQQHLLPTKYPNMLQLTEKFWHPLYEEEYPIPNAKRPEMVSQNLRPTI